MLLSEIKKAKPRFGLPADAPVVACYEVGRDGFWIHRFLVKRAFRPAVQRQFADHKFRNQLSDYEKRVSGCDVAGVATCW